MALSFLMQRDTAGLATVRTRMKIIIEVFVFVMVLVLRRFVYGSMKYFLLFSVILKNEQSAENGSANHDCLKQETGGSNRLIDFPVTL